MPTLTTRFHALRQRIESAATACGRDPAEIRLLAVSKMHPPSAIRTLHKLGHCAFGENYVTEALEKMDALSDLPLEWHYIGPIQSNKTRMIAERFDWVQSIDRAKIARRLSAQRPPSLPPLDCLIQVQIGSEDTKSGCTATELPELAGLVQSLPGLRLRGLMAIPPPADSFDAQRVGFAQLAALFRDLAQGSNRQSGQVGVDLDTLSMGMTGDLEAAIAEGSTLVRVGTDLFGPRPH